MAVTSLGRLTVDLMMKTGNIEAGSKEARKRFRELDKTVQDLEKKMATSFKIMGTAVLGFAGSLTYLTKKQLDLIATQSTLASSLNGTVTGLRAVNQAASDKNIDNLDASLTRLQRRIGAVENGTGPAVGAIKALNLSTRELANADADEKLAMIADAIKNAGISSQQATRYLQDLGFEQKGIYEVFRDGGDSLREYRKDIEALGIGIDRIEAQKVIQANNAIASMGDTFQGIQTQLAVQLSPFIEKIAKDFADWGKNSTNSANLVAQSIDTVINTVGALADGFAMVKRGWQILYYTILGAAPSLALKINQMLISIDETVVSTVNSMIDALNHLPGVDIERILPSEELRKKSYELTMEVIQNQEKIAEVLSEDLPSVALRKWVEEAKQASNEVAIATLESKVNLNDNLEQENQQQLTNLRDRLNAEIEILKLAGEQELQILALQRELKQLDIDKMYEDRLISEELYLQGSEANWEAYYKSIKDMDDKTARDRVAGTSKMFQNLSTLMNTNSRKLFEIGKAAAYANAVVTGAMAATEAYAWGLKYGGPYGPALGAAAMAASLAATGVQIAAIANTKFGGGSAGTSNTQAINNATEPVQQQTQEIYIRTDSPDDIVRVGSIVDAINEELNSGKRLVNL